MKVLQVNCVYPLGSTGKIVYCIHEALQSNNDESVICYGRGRRISSNSIYKTSSELCAKINNGISRLSGVMYGGCRKSTNMLINIILREKPDIVHVHCINGYFVNIYRFIEWLKNNKIKTVLTLHAEFMYTGNCGHALDCEKWKTGCGQCPRLKAETHSLKIDNTALSWAKMKEAFGGFNETLRVVSVSPWLKERAEQSPILKNKKHNVVLNGVDTNIFYYRPCEDFKEKLGFSNKKIVFHATAQFSQDVQHSKGGYYILELAKKLHDREDIVFIVAGKIVSHIKCLSNVILLDEVTDQNLLAYYYAMADVTVLTSKKETFSMVVAESLCSGTPVIGFKSGAPELISLDEYSNFVEQEDTEALKKELIRFLSTDYDKRNISKKAHQVYSKENMCKAYLEIYRELLCN